MKSKKVLFLKIILLCSFCFGALSTHTFAKEPTTQHLPLLQLKKFSEVYARIKNDYVETVDDKQLLTDAISGMLKGLDPHSDYLDEESFKELSEGTSGEFGGLGIEVIEENGFIKVIAPIDDTPAKKAGIKSGDLIIRLNNKSIKGMTLNQAVKLMRGKPGEAIDLMITREGSSSPLKITIVRAVIKVKSVKHKMLETTYGYLRISNFQQNTTSNTRKALENMNNNEQESLKGIILDLRDNPGGLLDAAAGVSDLFLNSGKIVITRGRDPQEVEEFSAQTADFLAGKPLVVLVNQGSASASEIVAGALQDHKRAIILGTKTFGKGSVQTVLPLGDDTGLKITTARYFTPLGRSIQAQGIQPDIIVKDLTLTLASSDKASIDPLSEADLSGHLSNPDNTKGEAKEAKTKDNSTSLAEEDYQLYEALNILKSMSLVRQMNLQ